MRRHPLTDVIRLVALALVLVLAGCQGTVGITQPPAGGVRVAVATAPGETLAFEPAEVEIGSVVPVTITFRNGSTLAHNLTFTDGLSAATRTIVEPGAVEELQLDPPAAGEYPFVCTIHAEMTGRLLVAVTGR